MVPARSPLLAAALVAAALACLPRSARADGFATPPGDDRARVARTHDFDDYGGPSFFDEPKLSVFRLLVGPAAKLDGDGAAPGLFVATEIGRGPAALRLSAAWMNVGTDHGVSQYTGELVLDFGGRSRVRPMVAAGGGVARTTTSQRADGTENLDKGATLGIGTVRGGVALRLPFEDADARVQLDVSGVFPAIRGSDAPDGLTPWAATTLAVAVGF